MSGDDVTGRSVCDVTHWLMQEFYNGEDFVYMERQHLANMLAVNNRHHLFLAAQFITLRVWPKRICI